MVTFKCSICGKTRKVPGKEMDKKKTSFCRECFLSKRIIHVVVVCRDCGKKSTVKKSSPLNKEVYLCKKCASKVTVKQAHKAVLLKGKQPSRISDRGYVLIYAPEHRLAPADGYIREHWLVVDSVIGEAFDPSKGHVVHHIDGNPGNNSKENLLVCPSQAYHQMIHKRKRAFLACGNPNWIKCHRCKEYADERDILVRGHVIMHPECYKAYTKEKSLRKKEVRLLNNLAA